MTPPKPQDFPPAPTVEFTLDQLLAHCIDSGGCLEWQGSMKDGRFPTWTIGQIRFPVRRELWKLVHGAIKPKHRVTVDCGNAKCVHVDHLIQRPRKAELAGVVRTAAFKAKIAAARRAGSVVDDAVVQLIRQSDRTQVDLAAELNLSQQYICQIRNHQRRAEYVTPFAGLGARS